ncbi:GTPase GUF1 [Sporobolomyces koalae]|uniref:GTPase GUF1 n=1 Tax=Sporobolomyces koalae TaxID=500713 RepID=UPI00317013A7
MRSTLASSAALAGSTVRLRPGPSVVATCRLCWRRPSVARVASSALEPRQTRSLTSSAVWHAATSARSPATPAATAVSNPSVPSLAKFPPERIRNFAIIAHIDHGKSTLADRMLELTGTIPAAVKDIDRPTTEEAKNEQVLDTLKVERERGITVRAQSATMFHTHTTATGERETYMLNLLDTPGHADFSSELLRSLLPSQGALLLVDAAQGVQAQTLSVLDEAMKRNLTVVGAVNKWDLVKDDGRGEAAVKELSDLLGCEESEILRLSAKTGLGVESVLEAVIERIPPPPPVAQDKPEPLQALVFDSYYDSFRGVVSLCSVFQGEIKKGDSITSTTSGNSYTVLDLGILSPREISIADRPDPAGRILRKGMVGWVVCGMKEVKDAYLGDTFHHTNAPMPPLESFKPLKSMVFAGIYPLDPGGFTKLEEAIRRLTLTDRSVTSNRESSTFLGQGFRLGFNGSLHMDVFRQRLEDEYGEEVIVTRPLVPVKLTYKDGTTKTIDNPADFPDPGGLLKVAEVQEPMIRATIVAPDEYTGAIINLCTSHRGIPLSHTYLSSGASISTASSETSTALKPRITLLYSLPLSSIITTFHSTLKSITSGFASFDYEEAPYEPSDLCRMNILVNSQKVDALCTVVHRSQVQQEGRDWAKRLRDVIPRQQYEVVIQAAVGSTIICRERVAPFKKDVTAKLYGGDVTRKMKLLAKQKTGKARLKERSIGRVTIPTEAFFSVLGGQESKRKGSGNADKKKKD